MEVICFQDAAHYALVEEVVGLLKTLHDQKNNKWISDVGTMEPAEEG